MIFSSFKELSGRTLPTVMTLTPEDKPGEKTEVAYEQITLDLPLEDDLFSLRNLQE